MSYSLKAGTVLLLGEWFPEEELTQDGVLMSWQPVECYHAPLRSFRLYQDNRLTATCAEAEVWRCEVRDASCELRGASCEVRAASCELRAVSCASLRSHW